MTSETRRVLLKDKKQRRRDIMNEGLKEIENAVLMRARAKLLENEATLLKEEANDTLSVLMPVYGLKNYSVEGIGEVKLKVSKGSVINKKKLTAGLLLHGIEPDDTDDIIGESSTTWETPVVEFKEG